MESPGGGALASLANCYASSSESDADDIREEPVTAATSVAFRKRQDEEESDSESSESSDSSSDDAPLSVGSADEDELGTSVQRGEKLQQPKTKGELGLDDLPPIEELTISVPEHESVRIGVVSTMVDKLVLVQSERGQPPLDLESVLFLDNGQRTLGRVFDVIGPVSEPAYCVRFNTAEEPAERGITIGTVVYAAPRTAHASLVDLYQLLRCKGSDASWKGNNEPPAGIVEFSDDEEEKRSRRKRKNNVQTNQANEETATAPTERPQRAPRPRQPFTPRWPPAHGFGRPPAWPQVPPPYAYPSQQQSYLGQQHGYIGQQQGYAGQQQSYQGQQQGYPSQQQGFPGYFGAAPPWPPPGPPPGTFFYRPRF